jgi:hypothetical protein
MKSRACRVFLIIKAFTPLGLHPSLLSFSPFPSVLYRGLLIEAPLLNLFEETFFLELTLKILDCFFDVVVMNSYFQCCLSLSLPYCDFLKWKIIFARLTNACPVLFYSRQSLGVSR